MNSSLLVLSLLLVSGLTACHKQTAPAQADMDAKTRQKAFEVRAAADKQTAAIKEAAVLQKTEIKEATAAVAAPAPLK
jgi:hypothetical protein